MAERPLILRKNDSALEEDKKESGKKEEELHLLPLVTYKPVGNPLINATPGERRTFMNSLSNKDQREPPLQRMVPHPVSRIFDEKRASAISDQLGFVRAQADMRKVVSGQEAMQERQKNERRDSLSHAPAELSQKMYACIDQLSFVLNDFSRGDPHKREATVSEFNSRLANQDYKADDLMSVLLLVIEDNIWGGEEGSIGGPKRFGGRISSNKVPLELRQTAKESAYVRLASVREMLRYYFERNPKDYAGALSLALGITADDGADQTFMQERLAYELAMIGGFALAQKLLAAIKLQKKMDTKKCLVELGYRYDTKGKKLVLGKRTCGTPDESRGIVRLLISTMKK